MTNYPLLLSIAFFLAYGVDLMFWHQCMVWMDLLMVGATGWNIFSEVSVWWKKRKE